MFFYISIRCFRLFPHMRLLFVQSLAVLVTSAVSGVLQRPWAAAGLVHCVFGGVRGAPLRVPALLAVCRAHLRQQPETHLAGTHHACIANCQVHMIFPCAKVCVVLRNLLHFDTTVNPRLSATIGPTRIMADK